MIAEMTDHELHDAITRLRRNRDAHLMDESDYTDAVISMLNEQKRAYANTIIGPSILHSEKCREYKNTQQIDKFCICLARQQNQLIEEQRSRNK